MRKITHRNNNPIIDNLYNQNMWMSDPQYRRLYRIQQESNLSDEQLQEFINQKTPEVKEGFAKPFARMGNKISYYNIPNLLFPVGERTEILISCKYKFQKLTGKYKVAIYPFYNYSYSPFKSYVPDIFTIEAINDKLRIPYVFGHEDMYCIDINYLLDDEELPLLSTKVYALLHDLQQYNFYKADLHMHTTYSDGYEPPELVTVSARENGMDIVAVTDHNCYEGSVTAQEFAQKMDLNMTVIRGEEYSLEYSPMHILSLGTHEKIDRKYLRISALNLPETQRFINKTKLNYCCNEIYAATQVLLKDIHRLGGISFLAHPYWKPLQSKGERMDTPEELFVELGKDRLFDGIEIVSGSPLDEFATSNLQATLSADVLGSLNDIPIIGITDSHCYSTNPISGQHFTVIFSTTKKDDDVLDALRNGRCVAVELIAGKPFCYGNHRLVKLVHFLLQYYFPQRDDEAKKEAMFIKEKFLFTNETLQNAGI